MKENIFGPGGPGSLDVIIVTVVDNGKPKVNGLPAMIAEQRKRQGQALMNLLNSLDEVETPQPTQPKKMMQFVFGFVLEFESGKPPRHQALYKGTAGTCLRLFDLVTQITTEYQDSGRYEGELEGARWFAMLEFEYEQLRKAAA